jgi:hypothetical protein
MLEILEWFDMKLIDLTGKRFNRLLVIGRDTKTKRNQAMWICRCDCGNTISVSGQSLRKGQISCNKCSRIFAPRHIKECENGQSIRKANKGLYSVWCNIKNRCDNPQKDGYKFYGGRGITYQESWKDFYNFYKDMHKGYSKGLEIDRIDSNGNYTKENCRWVTHQENSVNRRGTVWLKAGGQIHNIKSWANILLVDRHLVRKCLKEKYGGFERINYETLPYAREFGVV